MNDGSLGGRPAGDWMREDRLLLRSLRRGDEEALRRIYEKYKCDLLAVALCLVGDLSTAEDCLHDAFVGFAAASAGLSLRGSLKGYLAACVANRARDHLNRNLRWGALSEFADVAAEDCDPSAGAEGREQTDRLAAALGQLPWEQREAVVLHLRGGMKFREIARQAGISTNTVQSRYRYGLEKLRDLLNSGDEK